MHQAADTGFLARLGLVSDSVVLRFDTALTGDLLVALFRTGVSFDDLVDGVDLADGALAVFELAAAAV